MKKMFAIVLMLAFIAGVNAVPALGRDLPLVAQVPAATAYQGTWASSYGPYKGGLKFSDVRDESGVIRGILIFESSGCPHKKPFTGRYEDGGKVFIVNANLGVPCGRVGIKMQWEAGAWVGKYIADFPDGGDVRLSPDK